MDRIATFKTFIQRAPQDPFPRYGLAMEHRGRGELAEAWVVFQELLASWPDYVPTYLHAGGTLVALDRRAEARDVLERGIAAAARKGDAHAGRELAAALAELTPEGGPLDPAAAPPGART
jgi:hypothetical protein